MNLKKTQPVTNDAGNITTPKGVYTTDLQKISDPGNQPPIRQNHKHKQRSSGRSRSKILAWLKKKKHIDKTL
jgi:hypothetical protein